MLELAGKGKQVILISLGSHGSLDKNTASLQRTCSLGVRCLTKSCIILGCLIYTNIYIYIYIYKNIYDYARISYIHRYNLPTTKHINYRFTSPSIRCFLCVKHPTHAESRQSYRSANDTSASHGSLPRRWKKFNGEKVRGCEYVENMVATLPETNEYPLKSDGWKMTFPFGARDYSQGRTAVL